MRHAGRAHGCRAAVDGRRRRRRLSVRLCAPLSTWSLPPLDAQESVWPSLVCPPCTHRPPSCWCSACLDSGCCNAATCPLALLLQPRPLCASSPPPSLSPSDAQPRSHLKERRVGVERSPLRLVVPQGRTHLQKWQDRPRSVAGSALPSPPNYTRTLLCLWTRTAENTVDVHLLFICSNVHCAAAGEGGREGA